MKYLMIFLMVFILAMGLAGKWHMEWADQSELVMSVTNYGVIGHDVETGNAGGYWPKYYPAENYIYGAGIWFGGLLDSITPGNDTLVDTLVSLGYNPSDGVSEFCPGDGSDAPGYTSRIERIYNSRNDWPPRDLDSSIVYDSTVSFFDTYCFFSDKDPAQHFTTENLPLDITIKMNSYQWAGPLMDDAVILRLVIKNESDEGKDIHDCYVTYVFDCDIGNEAGSIANDLLGYIDTMTVNSTLKRMNTAYQFQLESESGWAHEPAIISVTLLESPLADSNIDLYHDSTYIIPAGSPIGMTSIRSFTLATDPGTKEERYQLLAGYDHLTFDPSNPEDSYEPFPYWSVNTPGYPGMSEDSTQSGNKRFALSCGPFDLAYGDSIIYAFAISINRTPDEIVEHIVSLNEFWHDSMHVSIISPADYSILSNETLFEWSCDSLMDSFALCFSPINNDTVYNITGLNTFSHTVDPTSVLPDGYYDWQIWNYNNQYTGIGSRMSIVGIDDSSMNCVPYIDDYSFKHHTRSMTFTWDILDTDDDSLYKELIFINTNSNYDTVYSTATWDDSLILNTWELMPNGHYETRLIASDPHAASDTAFTGFILNYDRPSDTTMLYSGNNDILTIKAEVVNHDSLKFHDYYVIFDNPSNTNDTIHMPFIVYDSTDMHQILSDTVNYAYNYYSMVFYTDIFDGINLRMDLDSINGITSDSIAVINDIGDNYPDSVLDINNSNVILSGRDIIIEWSSMIPTAYCENYPNNIMPFDTSTETNCSYHFWNYDTDSISSIADTGRYFMYIGEYVFSGRRTDGQPYYALFDTITELPADGEVWRIYNSGERIPIKGDVYRFTPSGINLSRIDIDNKYSIHFDRLITGNMMKISVSGFNTYTDINIYDIQGRKVRHIFNGYVNGSKDMKIKMDMPPGIYFIKDNKNPEIYDSKFIILR